MLEERIKTTTCTALNISTEIYNEDLGAGDIPEWDSLGHVGLLQAIEKEFDISLDVGDAIDIETISDLVTTVGKYVTEKGH